MRFRGEVKAGLSTRMFYLEIGSERLSTQASLIEKPPVIYGVLNEKKVHFVEFFCLLALSNNVF
jgi:hypothetical protein